MDKDNRKQRKRKRRKRLLTIFGVLVIIGAIIIGIIFKIHKDNNTNENIIVEEEKISDIIIEESPKEEIKEIVISFAGDCTLGTDTRFNQIGSFPDEIKNLGYDYSKIMRNVSKIFKEDDYTIVNLETTFTESNEKAYKGTGEVYHFKGPKEYVNILTKGYIEGVTISNNHSYDYGQKGLDDTRETLKSSNIDYCGYGDKIIKEVNGIKIGILGYSVWGISDEVKSNIKKDIDELKDKNCDVIIPYFHWGEESKSKPNEVQREIGRFSIDSGATMVVGSHSHVIQTIENYKGKLIVYSLGNFSFGGNSNPSDKRTFILQGKFTKDGGLISKVQYKIIPAYISSTNVKNDYAPTIAEGKDGVEITNYINSLSEKVEKNNINDYFSVNKIE